MKIYAVVECYGSEGEGSWTVPVRHFEDKEMAEFLLLELEVLQEEALNRGYEASQNALNAFLKIRGLEDRLEARDIMSSDFYLQPIEVVDKVPL